MPDPPPPARRPQLLVLLRHGAFCDERGGYRVRDARLDPTAYEEALAFEMQAASQVGGWLQSASRAALGLLWGVQAWAGTSRKTAPSQGAC